jgi:hypothetical protein
VNNITRVYNIVCIHRLSGFGGALRDLGGDNVHSYPDGHSAERRLSRMLCNVCPNERPHNVTLGVSMVLKKYEEDDNLRAGGRSRTSSLRPVLVFFSTVHVLKKLRCGATSPLFYI